MRRLLLCSSAFLALMIASASAFAQDEPPATQTEEPIEEKAHPQAPQQPSAEQPKAAAPGTKGSWSDIVVIPRKEVLKTGRVELAPFWGVTTNDPLIRHWAFGGQINYFFSDAFGVGLEGIYYLRERSDRAFLIGSQYYRVPTLNEMKWETGLNFTYVPIYGKFAFFNRNIIHWEITAMGGVGLTKTAIIPRVPNDAIFENYDITPNLGVGGRVYLSRWLAVWFNLRDHVYPDKFESPSRTAGMSASEAQSHAQTQIVNNVLFELGASFFLPTGFAYHTPR